MQFGYMRLKVRLHPASVLIAMQLPYLVAGARLEFPLTPCLFPQWETDLG
jgi:hypothetical protein